ncbi:ribosome small subunit-dependent GTPase A [Actinacidiphila acidipaludis]|uniref:Small ribosomal subunit biogenesis GTPase RsgA n=1 Tax=Actinacidiphila acidipaludis TaxID=2873382 RepID=A0ABS7Q9I7_9ACTN|nr:ribosome small subunit-dependent GTPase A [Streptomyces acidipaludis]MBY8878444.1 ribosome small subunit-dependent GTPase A [Streptomyces acidipaludis]
MSFSFRDASSHALVPYGWDDVWEAEFAPYAAQGLVPGRVVRVDRNACDVFTPDGTVRADTSLVMPPDPMRIVCTGDWAAVDPAGADPRLVRELLPRRSQFVRSTSSKRSEGQVLAANVDHAVVCVSLAAELDLGRLERFLSLAWESGAEPLVVLTKADLVPDVTYLLADAEAAAPGVQVVVASAATGEGLDVLAAVLGGGTAVLLGQSGAGKSTLTNALTGAYAQEVQAIRDADGKGRHTTTTRDMLPLPDGGVLIDTPGLRGVGLWDAESGVSQVFAEIEALAADCRFQDCSHQSEPGCAVLAALEDGTLPHRRLDSYRKLLRENAWIASRTDQRLRAEMRREWKQRSAAGREMYERKRGGGGGHRRVY